ncbi:MAG TPA: diacylglycerol kinase [Microbacteriaceae bacterium]|jgi:diacylglycerol kinase family enzyme|nr:diacylglycerol kinase [Microbacteriaceae bacterium]
MSHSKEKVAAVIYNPTKVDSSTMRSILMAEAQEAGWAAPTFFETSMEDVGQGMASQALAEGADLIFAAGGDGTVRAVAEVVHSSGVPLAVLPAGTGNLLARNLRLTLDDMPGSVRSAFAGVDRSIDVGLIEIERADGSRDAHAFVVMAGMGIDAKMIKNTDDDLKDKVGWAAYVDAIVKSLRDPDELHLQFRLDGGPRTRRTVHTLILGNCGSLPANILLMPDAVVDDGLFDLMMTRPGGAWGWLRVWAKVAWTNGVIRRTKTGRAMAGERKNTSDLHYETGNSFEAHLTRPEEIELDGDDFGQAVGFTARINAGALIIRVPARSET